MTTTSSGGSVVSVASSASAAAAGGSVINVSSLVSQLVAATRAPQDALIASQTQAVTTQISAIGTLKGALSSFQSALTPISTTSAFGAMSASSSDSTVFSASAIPGAVGGTYSLSVSQLAQAQQLLSKPFAGGGAATVGTGTLHLALGSQAFDLSIDASNDTLSGVAAAINAASGNPGITATVINGTDGAHLVLSSSQTGAANAIAVTETDPGTALAALTYDSGNTANYTQNAAAQDAEFSLAGVAYSSPTNTVTDALSGVILTLNGKTAPGASATLTVGSDSATVKGNIQAFVKAYNDMQSALAPLGSFDQTTGTAGPMLGDALLTGTTSRINRALHSIVQTGSPVYTTLASIGITTAKDGSLSIDDARLSKALNTAPGAVSALFAGTGGIASTLAAQLDTVLASDGMISSRGKNLIDQENALTRKTTDLNAQMDELTKSLTQQYAALNTLLSSLQTTSAYLSQAFASLPTVHSSGRNG